ncbi:MAG: thioredoxin domain-containing protein [Alphaproteobacteria bacterium]|jgi:protein-disulfide isomerase|nr:thioredoxin domain-containing protein [Alphaproteobacteria bacterium]
MGAVAGLATIAGGVPLRGVSPRIALAQDWQAQVTDFDKIKGSADAPVTVIEYASLTCGHCASFHTNTLPDFTAQYIDSGQVRMIWRQFPLNGLDLRAGMMARCAPENRFFGLLDVLFATQADWVSAEDPLAALARIGRTAGLSQDQIDACFADEALADRIVQVRLDAEQKYDVAATPTFVVQGEVVPGNRPLSFFAEMIDPMLDA